MYQTILDRIRTAREKENISRRELGELLGISDRSYYNLETGRSKFSVPQLLKVCERLKVNLFAKPEQEQENSQELIVLDAEKVSTYLASLTVSGQENRKEIREINDKLDKLLSKLEKER